MLYGDGEICEDYEDWRRRRDEDMLALALGGILIMCEKTVDWDALVERVRTNAEKCLMGILTVLERQDLSDFECVEEIVLLLEEAGLSTSRHDFG